MKPMLCSDGKGSSLPSGPGWRYQRKIDGWRFLFEITEDGVISYGGRNGKTYVVPVAEQLRHLPAGTILDAELAILGESSPKVATYLAHPEYGLPAHVFVFDILAVAGHDATRCPWHERQELLDKAAERFDGVEVTMLDAEEGPDAHDRYIDEGYEGSVAKQVDSLYVPGKRSREWIKFKPQHTIDGRIVGFKEGKSSWAGEYGAFKVELLENAIETTCAIPTKTMRSEVTADPDAYEGKAVELLVSHTDYVRHPVFSRMRPDLDEGAA